MNLHGQIMNIPATPAQHAEYSSARSAYLHGHRDARHAAAELALKADACIEALRAIVASAERHESGVSTFLLLDAREALAALDGRVLVSG